MIQRIIESLFKLAVVVALCVAAGLSMGAGSAFVQNGSLGIGFGLIVVGIAALSAGLALLNKPLRDWSDFYPW